MVLVDHSNIWGESQEEMVDNHGRVLGGPPGRGFNVAVHKYRHFVAAAMKWPG